MRRLDGLTTEPFQTFQIPLDDGTRVDFTLRYRPAVQMWFLDWSYLNKESNGNRICSNVNLLCQYRNNIPFGLLVRVNNDADPFLIDDFSSGRVELYILNSAEVEEVENAFLA